MKSLFLICLKYPLINAINIQAMMNSGKSADIVIVDCTPDMIDIANRLEKTNLFDNVYILPRLVACKELKECIRGKNRNLKNIIRLLSKYIGEIKLLTNHRKYLDSIIKPLGKSKTIDFSSYDEVFVDASEKNFRIIIGECIKTQSLKSINEIEEGTRNYVIPGQLNKYLNKFSVEHYKIYVYEPSLVMSKHELSNVEYVKLPKINKSNVALRNLINIVFDYHGDDGKFDFQNKIVYFEQFAEPMPKHFVNANVLLRIIGRHSYLKHLREHLQYVDKCKVFKVLSECVSKYEKENNFLVKLHPRTKMGVPVGATKYAWENTNKVNIPWEVYLLNNTFDGSIWVSSFSSAVINQLYIFEDSLDIKIVLSYFTDAYFREHEIENLGDFLLKLQSTYKNVVFCPQEEGALRRSLNYLLRGGDYE